MKSKILQRLMKIQILILVFVFAGLVLSGQEHEGVQIDKLASAPLGLSISAIDGVTVTPATLVEKLIGNGISYSNVVYTGPDLASGIFSGGNSAGIAVDTGVVLSCGLATNAIGPNQVPNISEAWFTAGDADLSAIIGSATNDAAVLEFDFIPTKENLEIRYVFGSEEYNEFVFSFNDVFAFFLDGVNIALLPDGITPVSIDNINNGNSPAGQLGTGPCMNCSYYIDNATGLYDTEMDGYTTLLIGSANVTPGQTHHIKLAVADALDSSLDTWVMIESKSFGAPPQVPMSNWAIVISVILIGLVIWIKRGRLF